MEPVLLLRLVHMNSRKIWLKKLAHQTAGREIGLQEDDQVLLGQNHAGTENYSSRSEADGLVEGVETGCRQHKSTHVRDVGQAEDGQGDSGFATKPVQEHANSLGSARGVGASILHLVLGEVRIVHISDLVRVVVLMLLDVRHVHPLQRVHEHVVKGRSHVAHQRHQEQRYLKNMIGEQVECVDNRVVP